MWSQLTSTHLIPLAMNYSLMHIMRRHLMLVNPSISLQTAHNWSRTRHFTGPAWAILASRQGGRLVFERSPFNRRSIADVKLAFPTEMKKSLSKTQTSFLWQGCRPDNRESECCGASPHEFLSAASLVEYYFCFSKLDLHTLPTLRKHTLQP